MIDDYETNVSNPSIDMLVFVIILIISIIISLIVSYLSTVNSFFPIRDWFINRANTLMSSILSYYQHSSAHNNTIISVIINQKEFHQPIQIYKTNVFPENKDYYKILSVSVNYTNNDILVFSMDLAGNPNNNQFYETAYVWLLYFDSGNKNYDYNHNKDRGSKEQIYTLIISNFGPYSNFKVKGWYMAVFNNTNNSYTLPMVPISVMPDNKVIVNVPPYLIGGSSSFNYLTSVLVRVNSTYLNKPPDYVMDSLPYDNKFWQHWFSSNELSAGN